MIRSKEVTVTTTKPKEVIDITDLVTDELSSLGAQDGICHVFVTHTTAALTTADLDPGTDLDMLDAFEKMIPKLQFRHLHDPTHVSDHILSSLMGASVNVPTSKGRLVLGSWQRIVLFEFNGPRERRIIVSVL